MLDFPDEEFRHVLGVTGRCALGLAKITPMCQLIACLNRMAHSPNTCSHQSAHHAFPVSQIHHPQHLVFFQNPLFLFFVYMMLHLDFPCYMPNGTNQTQHCGRVEDLLVALWLVGHSKEGTVSVKRPIGGNVRSVERRTRKWNKSTEVAQVLLTVWEHVINGMIKSQQQCDRLDHVSVMSRLSNINVDRKRGSRWMKNNEWNWCSLWKSLGNWSPIEKWGKLDLRLINLRTYLGIYTLACRRLEDLRGLVKILREDWKMRVKTDTSHSKGGETPLYKLGYRYCNTQSHTFSYANWPDQQERWTTKEAWLSVLRCGAEFQDSCGIHMAIGVSMASSDPRWETSQTGDCSGSGLSLRLSIDRRGLCPHQVRRAPKWTLSTLPSSWSVPRFRCWLALERDFWPKCRIVESSQVSRRSVVH